MIQISFLLLAMILSFAHAGNWQNIYKSGGSEAASEYARLKRKIIEVHVQMIEGAIARSSNQDIKQILDSYLKREISRLTRYSESQYDGEEFKSQGRDTPGTQIHNYPDFKHRYRDQVSLNQFLKDKIDLHQLNQQMLELVVVREPALKDDLGVFIETHKNLVKKWGDRLEIAKKQPGSFLLPPKKDIDQLMGFSWANKRGLSGMGNTALVVEKHFDLTSHPVFKGKYPHSKFPEEVSDPSTYDHGNHVSGIIAQKAPASNLVMVTLLQDDLEQAIENINPDVVNWSGAVKTKRWRNALTQGAQCFLKTLGSDFAAAAAKDIAGKRFQDLRESMELLSEALNASEWPTPKVERKAAEMDRDDLDFAVNSVKLMLNGGGLLINSIGNDYVSLDGDYNPFTEKSKVLQEHENQVILVTNLQQDGVTLDRASNSPGKKHAKMTLSAVGTDVHSALHEGYGEKTGTSMAAPFVAGAALLLKEIAPGLSRDQLRDCLLNGATPIVLDKDHNPVEVKGVLAGKLKPDSSAGITQEQIDRSQEIYGMGRLNVKGAALWLNEHYPDLIAKDKKDIFGEKRSLAPADSER